jgi:hypothetical protein
MGHGGELENYRSFVMAHRPIQRQLGGGWLIYFHLESVRQITAIAVPSSVQRIKDTFNSLQRHSLSLEDESYAFWFVSTFP